MSGPWGIPGPGQRALPTWFKLGVSVAVAVVSVAVAVVLLLAARIKDEAAALDKRSVLQTAELAAVRIQIESEVRTNQREFARYRTQIAEANALASAAAAARAQGNRAEASALEGEAARLRTAQDHLAGDVLLTRGGTLDQYVKSTGSGPVFDEAGRRSELARSFEVGRMADPSETAAAAERVRARSFGLSQRVVALAVALALLTVARVLGDARRRAAALWLAGSAVALFSLVLASLVPVVA